MANEKTCNKCNDTGMVLEKFKTKPDEASGLSEVDYKKKYKDHIFVECPKGCITSGYDETKGITK